MNNLPPKSPLMEEVKKKINEAMSLSNKELEELSLKITTLENQIEQNKAYYNSVSEQLHRLTNALDCLDKMSPTENPFPFGAYGEPTTLGREPVLPSTGLDSSPSNGASTSMVAIVKANTPSFELEGVIKVDRPIYSNSELDLVRGDTNLGSFVVVDSKEDEIGWDLNIQWKTGTTSPDIKIGDKLVES